MIVPSDPADHEAGYLGSGALSRDHFSLTTVATVGLVLVIFLVSVLIAAVDFAVFGVAEWNWEKHYQ